MRWLPFALAVAFAAGAASASQDPARPPGTQAAPAADAVWHRLVPGVQAAGRGRLRVWGFEVYDASLWVGTGFRAARFEQHPFALEIAYLRAFAGADIAARSIAEMRRAGRFDDAQAQRWRSALEAVLPAVAPGDRLTGVHRPGRGAIFLMNGEPIGEIMDAEFAGLFFGIWLGAGSSEPGLRRQLLAGTAP